MASYDLQIGAWRLNLSHELYMNLKEAIERHESYGYQSGETRLDRVRITECADGQKAEDGK